MKKLIFAFGILFLVSSCASGWSCKKRYCVKDTKAKYEVVVNATP